MNENTEQMHDLVFFLGSIEAVAHASGLPEFALLAIALDIEPCRETARTVTALHKKWGAESAREPRTLMRDRNEMRRELRGELRANINDVA